MSEKQYGSMLCQFKGKDFPTGETQSLNWVELSLKRSAGHSNQSQQKRVLREAFQDDPSIFKYNEVFDTMKEKQNKESAIDKKPKYIYTILKEAEKRKLKYEQRIEKKVQQQRNEENGQFTAKESFISMSYLKKLQELERAAKAEEVEKLIEEKYQKAGRNEFCKQLFNQRFSEIDVPKPLNIEHKEIIVKPKGLRRQNSTRDSADEAKNVSIKEEPLSDSRTTLVPRRKKRKMHTSDEVKETPTSLKSIRIRKVTRKDKLKKIQELMAKHTIGEKYVEAIHRYYGRKACFGEPNSYDFFNLFDEF